MVPYETLGGIPWVYGVGSSKKHRPCEMMRYVGIAPAPDLTRQFPFTAQGGRFDDYDEALPPLAAPNEKFQDVPKQGRIQICASWSAQCLLRPLIAYLIAQLPPSTRASRQRTGQEQVRLQP